MVQSASPILICTDLQSHSRMVLEQGLRLARVRNAPAVIIHVVHETAETAGFYQSHNKASPTTPLRDTAQHMLQNLTQSVLDDLPADQHPSSIDLRVSEGIPQQRIVEVADLLAAACIIMITHGRSTLGRLWHGSVSEAVTKSSHCEVHTLPAVQFQHMANPLASTAEPAHFAL